MIEILPELPKCDTETWSEQMLLEKIKCLQPCSAQDCHNIQFVKNAESVKNKVKHRKMGYIKEDTAFFLVTNWSIGADG